MLWIATDMHDMLEWLIYLRAFKKLNILADWLMCLTCTHNISYLERIPEICLFKELWPRHILSETFCSQKIHLSARSSGQTITAVGNGDTYYLLTLLIGWHTLMQIYLQSALVVMWCFLFHNSSFPLSDGELTEICSKSLKMQMTFPVAAACFL